VCPTMSLRSIASSMALLVIVTFVNLAMLYIKVNA
jgi:hypothetical protein